MEKETILNGKWKIHDDENKYFGNLHIYEEKKLILLQLIISATDENPLPVLKNVGPIPTIQGEITSGGSILLYDAYIVKNSSTLMSNTEYLIKVKYAFWNLKSEKRKNLKFNKISVNFGEIIDWTDLCYFDWEIREDGHRSLKWFHKDDICFTIQDKMSITFMASLGTMSTHITKRHTEIEQQVSIIIEYPQEKHWDDIIADIRVLNNLLTLGINKKIFIEEIKYSQSIDVEGYDHLSMFKCFLGTQEEGNHKEGKWYDYLFDLSCLMNDGFTSLNMWYKKYDMLKPVIELYESSYNYLGISDEMLFLNLMQALETYHARFISDDLKSYIQIVDTLLRKKFDLKKEEAFSEHILEWRKVLLAQDEKKFNKINLRSRLGYLFVNEFDIIFYTLKYKLDEFIDKLINSRNYYTHYAVEKQKLIFSKEEIPYSNGILIAVLQYYLLKEINIDITIIHKKIGKQLGQTEEGYNIYVKQ